MSNTTFQQEVYTITKKILRGKVATYGEIARALGQPKAARAVGNALNNNRYGDVPCHRIIRSNGHVGGYAHGTKKKILILKREGVKISKHGIVNLSRYGYKKYIKNS